MLEIGVNRGLGISSIRDEKKITAFTLVTLGFLILHAWAGVTTFRYDAAGYWALSSLDYLLHFPKHLRGYFYPLILSPARLIADYWPASGLWPFRIFWSAICAYVFAILIPNFYILFVGGRASLVRRLVPACFAMLLMPGVILYPLSDLPALALLIGAMLCAKHAQTSAQNHVRSCGYLILAGFLAYGAYNTRTIYLFSVVLLLVAVLVTPLRTQKLSMRVTTLLCFILGVLIAAAPQMISNKRNFGVATPALISHTETGSLFASQLLWGVTIQRYETSVDPQSPAPSVYYLDLAGQKLFDRAQLEDKPFTVKNYLELAYRNPWEILGIYGRHFINGLDLRDGEVYLSAKSVDRPLLSLINFAVLYLALMIALGARLCVKPEHDKGGYSKLWLLILFVPTAAILPGAIETRFFIAIHLAAYYVVALHGVPTELAGGLRRRPVLVALSFLCSLLVFYAISTSTMQQVQYKIDPKYIGAQR